MYFCSCHAQVKGYPPGLLLKEPFWDVRLLTNPFLRKRTKNLYPPTVSTLPGPTRRGFPKAGSWQRHSATQEILPTNPEMS